MAIKTKKSFLKVSIIIPNWNGSSWLPGCLDGLNRQSYKDFQVIMVDNGSTDDSLTLAKKHFPNIEIICLNENRGFAAAVNIGIQNSKSDYIALLNVDTVPNEDWLLNLVNTMETSPPEVGSLASKMLDMSNPNIIENAGDILTWQGAAMKRGHGSSAVQYNSSEKIFSACAGASFYRRSYLEALGGFDEHFFAYLEDIDLGLRGQLLGYRCLFVPNAQVLHKGHSSALTQSRYVRLMTRNRLMMLLKNIPLRLLLKNIGSILYGQIYFFVCYKKPFSSIMGYISFFPLIWHISKTRRIIQQKRRLSCKEIDSLLVKKIDGPGILRSLINRMRRREK